MTLIRKACSATYYLAQDSNGCWFMAAEGESQRPVTDTELIGIFTAAINEAKNTVTGDTAESHTARELLANAEY